MTIPEIPQIAEKITQGKAIAFIGAGASFSANDPETNKLCPGLLGTADLLTEMKNAKNSRKAIVIISDGGDNHSHYTSKQIEALVRDADVQIYAMGVFEPNLPFAQTPEEVSGPTLLSEIATQTGGRAFSASLSSDLPSVAARIAVELRNQYVLGYYPKNENKDGLYRHVEVKLGQPRGVSPLKAHWRLGYYAPVQ